MSRFTEIILVEGLNDNLIGRKIGPYEVKSYDILNNAKEYACLKELNLRCYVRHLLNIGQSPNIICLKRSIEIKNLDDKRAIIRNDNLIVMIILHLLDTKMNDAVVICGALFDENQICKDHGRGTVFEQIPIDDSKALVETNKKSARERW